MANGAVAVEVAIHGESKVIASLKRLPALTNQRSQRHDILLEIEYFIPE